MTRMPDRWGKVRKGTGIRRQTQAARGTRESDVGTPLGARERESGVGTLLGARERESGIGILLDVRE